MGAQAADSIAAGTLQIIMGWAIVLQNKGCGWAAFVLALTMAAAVIYVPLKLGDAFAEAIERAIRDFFLIVEGAAILAAFLLTLGGVVWSVDRILRRLDESNRQRDGAWKLQRHKMFDGTEIVLDPSRTSTAGYAFNPEIGAVDLPSRLSGPELVEMYKSDNLRGAMQAIYPGDAGHRDAAHPIKLPNLPAAMFRDPKKKIKAPPEAIEPLPMGDGSIVAYPAALAGDDIENLTLGHTPDGQPFRWMPGVWPHLRFHGKTQGSGKTNAIINVAGAGVSAGAHVVVTDLRRFVKWSALKNSIEMIDANDVVLFGSAIGALHAEFMRRDQIINEAGVMRFSDAGLTRIIFIIGEFGATWKRTKADHPAFKTVERQISELAQMAGSTGINLIAEDQTPGKDQWPREFISNATPVAGYGDRMYGQITGSTKPHDIDPYHFSLDGRPENTFKTYDMQEDANVLHLQSLPALNGYRVASTAPATGSAGVSWGNETMFHGSPQETPGNIPGNIPTREDAGQETSQEANGGDGFFTGLPMPTESLHGEAYKQNMIIWFIDNFDGSQAECRRWAANNGIEISTGYISKVYNGRRAQAPQPPAEDGQPAAGDDSNVIDLNTPAGRAMANDLAKMFEGRKDIRPRK